MENAISEVTKKATKFQTRQQLISQSLIIENMSQYTTVK